MEKEFKINKNMIDGKEVRLGNWLIPVSEIREEFRNKPKQFEIEDLEYLDCFAPIPLTEEVLLNFGLVKDEGLPGAYIFPPINGYFMEGLCYYDYSISIVKDITLEAKGISKYHDKIGKAHNITPLTYYKIQYLHQLQNAFFGLFGRELEIDKGG